MKIVGNCGKVVFEGSERECKTVMNLLETLHQYLPNLSLCDEDCNFVTWLEPNIDIKLEC